MRVDGSQAVITTGYIIQRFQQQADMGFDSEVCSTAFKELWAVVALENHLLRGAGKHCERTCMPDFSATWNCQLALNIDNGLWTLWQNILVLSEELCPVMCHQNEFCMQFHSAHIMFILIFSIFVASQFRYAITTTFITIINKFNNKLSTIFIYKWTLILFLSSLPW